VAGVSCPEPGFETCIDSLQQVLDQISQANAHVLFVGLGAPKQELFIRDYIQPLQVPIAMGVGGSFEILSGILGRAPLWMQKSGLEWLFRLCHEPGRLWKRYLLGNVEFLLQIARWRLSAIRPSADAYGRIG
jgi:N-acetylglucosaminyldiphosphoundecaprenol N-acetyl-beta-D-mannosaminyltransferase